MRREANTCALCPRLCRPACPVAVGSRREAAVPANIARVLVDWDRGKASPELAAQAVTLCVDCGACEDWCHLGIPLPQMLREARAELLPEPLVEPLRPVEGKGRWLAIEADGRPLAEALSKRLGEPVRRWFTADALGSAAVEHAAWERRASEIRKAVGDAEVVVTVDGGVGRALEAAEVPFKWLHEAIPGLAGGLAGCRMDGERPLRCCGGADPLHHHHPEDARRLGKAWLARATIPQVLDGRCRNHLLACGGVEVTDPLDRLLSEEP